MQVIYIYIFQDEGYFLVNYKPRDSVDKSSLLLFSSKSRPGDSLMCLNLLVRRLFCTWAGGGDLISRVRSLGVNSVDGVTGNLNAFDTSFFWFSFWVVLFRVQRLSLPGLETW